MVVQSQFIEMFDRCSESFKKYPISDLCHSSNDIKCGPFGTQLKQAEYTDQGIPVWGIPQINSGFTLAPDVFVSEEKARQLEQFSLVSEDIAMSRKGNVGQCALYPDSFEDGIIASDVVRIRVNKEMILPHFLVYQLHNSHQIRKQILEVSDGTVMAGINVTKMKGIIVYCPPISSQQEFKTILEQADKSKFDGLKSQFISQFGFPQDGAEKYPSATVESLLQETISGEWGTDCSNDSGTKVIRTTNFTNEGVLDLMDVVVRTIDAKKVEKKQLKKGDIILEKSGGTKDNPVGRLVYFEEEGVFLANNFTQVLRPAEDINSRYLFAALYYLYQTHKPLIKGLGNQTNGIQNLKVPQYLQLQISVPDRTAQDDFERICRQADKSKFELKQAIEKIDKVMRALMQ